MGKKYILVDYEEPMYIDPFPRTFALPLHHGQRKKHLYCT